MEVWPPSGHLPLPDTIPSTELEAGLGGSQARPSSGFKLLGGILYSGPLLSPLMAPALASVDYPEPVSRDDRAAV